MPSSRATSSARSWASAARAAGGPIDPGGEPELPAVDGPPELLDDGQRALAVSLALDVLELQPGLGRLVERPSRWRDGPGP